MDPRLLDYYNQELNYLHELGGEFAARHPKIASRLGMRGIEVEDPYVERLLEGFCFLSARIRLKMDAEFPRFSQQLLELIYPNYLAPTPSMAIAQFVPGELAGGQGGGFRVARGERLRSPPVLNQQGGCEFRTAHEVELWPLELASAQLQGIPQDLELQQFARPGRVIKSSLRLVFRYTAPLDPGQAIDRLPLHLCGSAHIASRLYALLCGHGLGCAVRCQGKQPSAWHYLGPDALVPEGFAEQQALLPYSARGFQGYRLLHEYFAFPSRYHFVAVEGLADALRNPRGAGGFELVIPFDDEAGELERTVDTSHFALFCTPVVNLMSMRSDRIHINDSRYEHHLVVDRAQPLNYEVHSVRAIEGFSKDNTLRTVFEPFYETRVSDHGRPGAYFSTRREPRRLSENAARNGTRSAYVGSEVFVSLVDQNQAPFDSDLRQLGVELTATNRDLPLLMTVGSIGDLSPVSSVPVRGVRILKGPTAPVKAIPEGQLNWRLISHLGLSYQGLAEQDPDTGAGALRELLSLYSSLGDAAISQRGTAVVGASIDPVTRRLPGSGPLVYGRGVGITVTVDESQFAGVSPFLFGAVLERFLSRHVGLNSFTQMRLCSAQAGQLHSWPPRFGTRPVA